EEPRHARTIVVLAVPGVARDGEDVRRRVASDLVEPLGADPLLDLHALGEGARVEVRSRIEHLVGGIEKHTALALARSDHAADPRAGRQGGERRARTPREGAPERARVEVEA